MILSCTLVSCKDSGSPKSICKLFLISLNRLDFATANSISTKQTRQFIKILKAESKGAIDEKKLEERAANFDIDIEDVRMINDSLAEVTFQTSPKLLPFNSIELIEVTEKLDKKVWKVNLSTVDLIQKMDYDLGASAVNNEPSYPPTDSTPPVE